MLFPLIDKGILQYHFFGLFCLTKFVIQISVWNIVSFKAKQCIQNLSVIVLHLH